jgi:hypothetical protein
MASSSSGNNISGSISGSAISGSPSGFGSNRASAGMSSGGGISSTPKPLILTEMIPNCQLT